MYLFYRDVTLNDYDERKYHNMCEMPGTVLVSELYLLYTSVSMAKFIPDLKAVTFCEIFWFHHI